jgi:hypothetical protein
MTHRAELTDSIGNMITPHNPNVKSIEDQDFLDVIIPETAAGFAARFSRISETLLPSNHVFSSRWRHDLSDMLEAALHFKASSVVMHQIFEFMNFPPSTSHDRGDLVGEEAVDADQLWRLVELRIDHRDTGSSADARTNDPI